MDSLYPGIQVWILPGELPGFGTSALPGAGTCAWGSGYCDSLASVPSSTSGGRVESGTTALGCGAPPLGSRLHRGPGEVSHTDGGTQLASPPCFQSLPGWKGRVDPEGSRFLRQTSSCSSSSLRAGRPALHPAQAERPS